jgi:hypothetical protein
MIVEVEQYITKHYYELLKIAKKYTKTDDWASELLHEIILQLYDAKSTNNKMKLDDKSIKYYIVRIITINWCYPSSPFYKKYKKDSLTHVEITEAIELMNQQTEEEEHKFIDIMEEEFGNVNWFNKIIFEKYLLLGSIKKVSVDTNITIPSIGRYVKQTRTQVKENTIKRYENE